MFPVSTSTHPVDFMMFKRKEKEEEEKKEGIFRRRETGAESETCPSGATLDRYITVCRYDNFVSSRKSVFFYWTEIVKTGGGGKLANA
jgi:hypothetical protein